MKDIRGIELEAGMTVAAAIQPYRNRYDLVVAKIEGFTAKMVRVSYPGTYSKEQSTQLISPYKLAVLNYIKGA